MNKIANSFGVINLISNFLCNLAISGSSFNCFSKINHNGSPLDKSLYKDKFYLNDDEDLMVEKR